MRSKFLRLAIALTVCVALLVAGGVAALRYATDLLKTQVETALGPESEVGSIAIENYAVVVRTLRMKAPAGWPANDAFRAERVAVEPDIRALFSGSVRVGSVVAENVYLCVFRGKEGGFRFLPSLLEGRAATPPPPAETEEVGAAKGVLPVVIDAIELRDGVVEIFDGQVRKKPHRIRIAGIRADLGPLDFPSHDVDTAIDVEGTVKGPRRDGRFAVTGEVRISDLDLEITTKLQGIDLVTLEPYLLESSETGVKGGTLDLDMRSKVEKRMLTAPGTMTLSHLELTGSTFMGMPRQAVLAAMKDHDDKITIRFNLSGSLDDPKFSLRENFAMRVATGVAEGLGISVRGLAGTLGGATQKLTDKLGDLLRR